MVYGAIVAKVCSTSHGQPASGSRRRTMMSSRRRRSRSGAVMRTLAGPAAPWQRGVADRDELAVEQAVALVVAERSSLQVDHATAGAFQHGLRGGCAPL